MASDGEAMKAMAKLPVALLAVVALLAAGGCNTVAGFGRDMQAAGNALASAAEKIAGGDNQTPAAAGEPHGLSGSSSP